MEGDSIEGTRSASAIGSVFLFGIVGVNPLSCPSRLAAAGSPHLSLTSPGLRPELYEAETRPTYGSEAEPHPSSNGAA
jgi:hypothetical protein